jgi:hypothetical protein
MESFEFAVIQDLQVSLSLGRMTINRHYANWLIHLLRNWLMLKALSKQQIVIAKP